MRPERAVSSPDRGMGHIGSLPLLRQTSQQSKCITLMKVLARQIHMNRVVKSPPGFPPGYFWYGNKWRCPGRLPKWIDRLVKKSTMHSRRSQRWLLMMNSCLMQRKRIRMLKMNLEWSLTIQTPPSTRTGTKMVKPPDQLMKISSGLSYKWVCMGVCNRLELDLLTWTHYM